MTLLKIISWNVRGLRARRTEVDELLKRHKPDVLALQETKMTDAHRISFEGYDTYRFNRPVSAGGVAILVKKTLEHAFMGTEEDAEIQDTSIEIETTRGKVRITSVYSPPNDQILEEDIRDLLQYRIPTILIGDLNCKSRAWNSTRRNAKGDRLERYADQENAIIIGPERPTYLPTGRGRNEVLDVAVLKNVEEDFGIETIEEGTSDHNPIVLTIGTMIRLDDDQMKHTTRWDSFSRNLKEKIGDIPVIRSSEELELATEALQSCILEAYQECTITTPMPRRRNDELPREIHEMVIENRRLRRAYAAYHTEENRRTLNRHSTRLRDRIKEFRSDRWDRRIQRLNVIDHSAWQMQKCLRRDNAVIPPLLTGNGMAYTNEEKAEAFAETLGQEGRLNEHPDEDEHHANEMDESAEWLRGQPSGRRIRNHVSPLDIKKIIGNLKARKATGCDKISNKMIKQMPRKAVMALTNITNAILRLDHFPQCWKHAEVVMLPKAKKDKKLPQSYRPISLLPLLSKVSERAIKHRLLDETDGLGLLPPEQFGFRAGHSTELQALRIVEYTTSGFNRRRATGAVLLDVERAFDRVWHNGLLHKMIQGGFERKTCKLMQSYLEGRSYSVKIGKKLSRRKDLVAGVPQGSVLGPHLYSLFTYDIPKTQHTMMALYADDCAILAQHRDANWISQKLQEAVSLIEQWCITWKIKINAPKSQAILFQQRRLPLPARIEIGNEDIPWSNEVRYLGITMDKRLTWKSHIEEARARTRAAMAQLYPLLGRKSTMSLKTKVTMIKVIARPQLTYGSTAWGHAAKSHRKRLAAVENIQLRRAANAPWYMRNVNIRRDLEWTPIEEFMRQKAEKNFRKAADHSNEELRRLTEYDPAIDRILYRRYHKRPKSQLLED